MSKSKIASRNNPTGRRQAKEFLFNGKKVKPVKLITEKASFLAAEYEDGGDLVLGRDNKALPWSLVSKMCSSLN